MPTGSGNSQGPDYSSSPFSASGGRRFLPRSTAPSVSRARALERRPSARAVPPPARFIDGAHGSGWGTRPSSTSRHHRRQEAIRCPAPAGVGRRPMTIWETSTSQHRTCCCGSHPLGCPTSRGLSPGLRRDQRGPSREATHSSTPTWSGVRKRGSRESVRAPDSLGGAVSVLVRTPRIAPLSSERRRRLLSTLAARRLVGAPRGRAKC